MSHTVHNKLVSFIWSTAGDCLRDVYEHGKYRDAILPMVVLRRLDTLREPGKEKVLEEVALQQNVMGLTELEDSGLINTKLMKCGTMNQIVTTPAQSVSGQNV